MWLFQSKFGDVEGFYQDKYGIYKGIRVKTKGSAEEKVFGKTS